MLLSKTKFKVISGVKGILNSYQSVNANNSKISKSLRLSKKGKKIGFVKKVPENNKMEKIQKIPENINAISAKNHNDEIDLDDNEE